MKKIPLIFLSAIILLAFTYSPPGQNLSIIRSGKKLVINSNDMVSLNGAPFTFEFTVPKTGEAIVTVYASTGNANYYKILKGASPGSLKPYDAGNAMSVQVNAFMQLDSTLAIAENAHQPFIYEGSHFSSFQSMDSTATDYILRYHVDSLSDGQDMMNKVYSIREFPGDTVYCVVTMDYKIRKKWKQLDIIPFRLSIK